MLSAIALLFLFSSAGIVRACILESQLYLLPRSWPFLGWIVFFIVLIGWYAIRHFQINKNEKYKKSKTRKKANFSKYKLGCPIMVNVFESLVIALILTIVLESIVIYFF